MTTDIRHELLYAKKLGRLAFLGRLLSWPLRHELHKRGRNHLANKRKQLVVFAFDHITHTINLDGIYEKDELDVFFEWTNSLGIDFKESTALDVGANIGNHSLYFSEYFKWVVSFEPNPRAFKVLALNAELAGNVLCHNFGLSDHYGEAVLSVDASNIGGASVTQSTPLLSQCVRLIDLDSFGTFSNVKLIKIDVEGHELKAIVGARRLIEDQMPIILFEQHVEDFIDGRSAIVALLKEFGYDHFAILKKHPRMSGNRIKRTLLVPLIRILVGETSKVELMAKMEPDYYPFIIALPNWMRFRTT